MNINHNIRDFTKAEIVNISGSYDLSNTLPWECDENNQKNGKKCPPDHFKQNYPDGIKVQIPNSNFNVEIYYDQADQKILDNTIKDILLTYQYFDESFGGLPEPVDEDHGKTKFYLLNTDKHGGLSYPAFNKGYNAEISLNIKNKFIEQVKHEFTHALTIYMLGENYYHKNYPILSGRTLLEGIGDYIQYYNDNSNTRAQNINYAADRLLEAINYNNINELTDMSQMLKKNSMGYYKSGLALVSFLQEKHPGLLTDILQKCYRNQWKDDENPNEIIENILMTEENNFIKWLCDTTSSNQLHNKIQHLTLFNNNDLSSYYNNSDNNIKYTLHPDTDHDSNQLLQRVQFLTTFDNNTNSYYNDLDNIKYEAHPNNLSYDNLNNLRDFTKARITDISGSHNSSKSLPWEIHEGTIKNSSTGERYPTGYFKHDYPHGIKIQIPNSNFNVELYYDKTDQNTIDNTVKEILLTYQYFDKAFGGLPEPINEANGKTKFYLINPDGYIGQASSAFNKGFNAEIALNSNNRVIVQVKHEFAHALTFFMLGKHYYNNDYPLLSGRTIIEGIADYIQYYNDESNPHFQSTSYAANRLLGLVNDNNISQLTDISQILAGKLGGYYTSGLALVSFLQEKHPEFLTNLLHKCHNNQWKYNENPNKILEETLIKEKDNFIKWLHYTTNNDQLRDKIHDLIPVDDNFHHSYYNDSDNTEDDHLPWDNFYKQNYPNKIIEHIPESNVKIEIYYDKIDYSKIKQAIEYVFETFKLFDESFDHFLTSMKNNKEEIVKIYLINSGTNYAGQSFPAYHKGFCAELVINEDYIDRNVKYQFTQALVCSALGDLSKVNPYLYNMLIKGIPEYISHKYDDSYNVAIPCVQNIQCDNNFSVEQILSKFTETTYGAHALISFLQSHNPESIKDILLLCKQQNCYNTENVLKDALSKQNESFIEWLYKTNSNCSTNPDNLPCLEKSSNINTVQNSIYDQQNITNKYQNGEQDDKIIIEELFDKVKDEITQLLTDNHTKITKYLNDIKEELSNIINHDTMSNSIENPPETHLI